MISRKKMDARFETSTGYYRRTDRGLLMIDGPDRVKFLHSLTSNDVKNALPGSFQRSCILNPMGKVLSEFHLFFHADFIWLETDLHLIDPTIALLNKFKLASRTNVKNVSSDWNQFVFFGPKVPMLEGAPAYPNVLMSDSTYVFVPHGKDMVPELTDGFFDLSKECFEALRIQQGIPIYGRDVGAENIIREVPYFDQAISYTKGCYPGQEIVARLQSRGGNIGKRLMGIHVTDAIDTDWQHANILFNGQSVGQITSQTSCAGNGILGMGVVHRNAFEPGTKVTLEKNTTTIEGTVVALPA